MTWMTTAVSAHLVSSEGGGPAAAPPRSHQHSGPGHTGATQIHWFTRQLFIPQDLCGKEYILIRVEPHDTGR